MNDSDLIKLIGKYTSEEVKEIHYRVIERLGILYEDKPATKQQVNKTVSDVEKEFK